MPRRDDFVPQHRGPAPEPAEKKRLRASILLSGVAVAVTGLAVSAGVLADDAASAPASLSAAPIAVEVDSPADDLTERTRSSASRSDDRSRTQAAANLERSQQSGGQVTRTADVTTADPRTIAQAMLPEFGFSESEFGCLDALYTSESDWDPKADNPTSSAFGIPQALTGGTHDDLPADYLTNPAAQIRWGLGYISESYGTPCSAWGFKQSNGWY